MFRSTLGWFLFWVQYNCLFRRHLIGSVLHGAKPACLLWPNAHNTTVIYIYDVMFWVCYVFKIIFVTIINSH